MTFKTLCSCAASHGVNKQDINKIEVRRLNIMYKNDKNKVQFSISPWRIQSQRSASMIAEKSIRSANEQETI